MLRYNYGLEDIKDTSAKHVDSPRAILKMLPGNPDISDPLKVSSSPVNITGYDPTTGAVVPFVPGTNMVDIRFDINNCILLGVTSDPKVVITSVADILKAVPDYTNEFGLVLGESLILTVAVFMKNWPYGSDTSYTVENVVLSKYLGYNLGSSVLGFFAGGELQTTLSKDGYKVFRIIFNPADYRDLFSDANYANPFPMLLQFVDSALSTPAWINMSLAGITTGAQKMLYKFVDSPLTPYPNTPILLDFLPSALPITWQTPLPDTALKNLTTNSYDIGKVAASPTQTTAVTAFIGLANTNFDKNVTYTITSIVITEKTSTVMMSAASKAAFATDYTIDLVRSGTVTATFPAFTGTSLTSTLTFAPTEMQLLALDSLGFNITYAPMLKIPATATYVLPFVAATAPTYATLANSARKISIQVMGYADSDNTHTPVVLGGIFNVTGGLI